METKVLTIKKGIAVVIFQFVLLIGAASLIPAICHQQTITGPIVNAILFISTVILGIQGAILVGLVPSVIALSVGLLPAVLAPMVPFIMIGNAILIFAFGYLREKNFWLGVILASVLKFLFLFGTSSIVINLLLKKEVASKVAAMMSYPQLLTAIAGGFIAYIALKIIRKI
jgi:hypothetical protein